MTDLNPRTMDLNRRRFLQGTALTGTAAFLAACGTRGTGSEAPSAAPEDTSAPSGAVTDAPSDAPTASVDTTPSAELNFANWPLYIDTDEDDTTKHKTLEDFTAEYGTVVKYSEVINDNNEFFGTIKAPLEAGQDSGWDLVVLTQWMAARIIRLGWVEQMDLANVPTFLANLEDAYRAPDFDPNNEFHAPWQAGMTGLGFDRKVTGDLTSSAALFDPKWKGRVTYLSEMRDAVGLTLQKLGYDPSTVTRDQFDEAIAEMKTAVDAKIVRAFTGNDYAEDLVSGNVVLAMAWSGDIIQKQLERASLRFAIPEEGGSLWYDNMLIPRGAQHKYTAELFIDFVYRPAIAAQIEAWVNYICPVKGAREELAKIDQDLADNVLIFPTDEMLAKVKRFKSLDEEEETYFNDEFSTLTGV
ncbi:MAG: extracellular solute-binding protein [Chloroflexi bacterium]|nr:extracellular solute-binding protein [Chloroflexota bacterium]